MPDCRVPSASARTARIASLDTNRARGLVLVVVGWSMSASFVQRTPPRVLRERAARGRRIAPTYLGNAGTTITARRCAAQRSRVGNLAPPQVWTRDRGRG